MNHFNLKSVKVANPITRQRVVDRGQDIVKIKIKHNENIVENGMLYVVAVMNIQRDF